MLKNQPGNVFICNIYINIQIIHGNYELEIEFEFEYQKLLYN